MIMFTIDCNYYTKTFSALYELLNDIINSGQDPNYQIIYNGEKTGVTAWELIQPQAWLKLFTSRKI